MSQQQQHIQEEEEQQQHIQEEEEQQQQQQPPPTILNDSAREAEARQKKEEGNKLYAAGNWIEAADHYTQALTLIPENHSDAAIFYGNRAACYLHMKRYDDVVTDCTAALKIQPKYIKALLRRAQANEQMNKYREALEDYQLIVQSDPNPPNVVHQALKTLPPLAQAQTEREKEEMLAKLKELGTTVGNAILKPFNLSVDNFQVKQDPTTKSYSINFVK